MLCPNCGGKAHCNHSRSESNFECMWRQYCMFRGYVSAPTDRLPIFTPSETPSLAEWVLVHEDAGTPVTVSGDN